MTDFKVGDRVRVTVESEVTAIAHYGWIVLAAEDVAFDPASTAYSIEKIAPRFPTTPGSVVSNNYTGSQWVLGAEGWRPVSAGAGATGFMFGDEKNYTVVFDASATNQQRG